MSRQAVSKWETNQSEPSTDNLIKLADLFDSDINQLTSPEKYMEEQKDIETRIERRQKDMKMHLSAFFGRFLVLVCYFGGIGAYSDKADSSLNWFWYGLFFIGLVLVFVASRDYFNNKLGSKKIVFFDLLFSFSVFLYNIMPFMRSINILLIMMYGAAIVVFINVRFFIPVWGKRSS